MGLGEHVSIVFIYVSRIFSSVDNVNGNVQIKLKYFKEKGTEQGVPITR